MNLPNFKGFKYSLSKEENKLYWDRLDYEIKEFKYFESMETETLTELWKDTSQFIGIRGHGGRAKGLFMKLKLKLKKESGVNSKNVAWLIINEMGKRNKFPNRTQDRDFWVEQLKQRNSCG